LWSTLDDIQAIQKPNQDSHVEDFVLRTLPIMYESFQADRVGLSDSQLIELRYEDFISDPVTSMARNYEQLQLGDFELIRSKIQEKSQQERDYQTNRLEMQPDEERMVMDAWNVYAQHYGYAS
jgi:hypothetical protein